MTNSAHALQTPLQPSPRVRSPFEQWWEDDGLRRMRIERAALIASGVLPPEARYWSYPQPCVVVDGRTAQTNNDYDALTWPEAVLLDVMKQISREQGHTSGYDFNLRTSYEELKSRTGFTKSRVKRTRDSLLRKRIVWLWDGEKQVDPRARVVSGSANREQTRYLIPSYDRVQRAWWSHPDFAVTQEPGPTIPRCVWTFGRGKHFVVVNDAERLCIRATGEKPVAEPEVIAPPATPSKPPAEAVTRDSAAAPSPVPPAPQPPPLPPPAPAASEPPPNFWPSQDFVDTCQARFCGDLPEPSLPNVIAGIREEAWKVGEMLDDEEIKRLFENVWLKGKMEPRNAAYLRKGAIQDLAYFLKRRKSDAVRKAEREARAIEGMKQQIREAFKDADEDWLRSLKRDVPDLYAQVEKERGRGGGRDG